MHRRAALRRISRRAGAPTGKWQAAWRNHTVADFQVDALLQPDGAGLVHEHAVTGGHTHGAAVGRAHFEELLIERMPDDALDGPEADRAIVHAEAKYFAQRCAGQFRDAVAIRVQLPSSDRSMNSPIRTMRVPWPASRTNTWSSPSTLMMMMR